MICIWVVSRPHKLRCISNTICYTHYLYFYHCSAKVQNARQTKMDNINFLAKKKVTNYFLNLAHGLEIGKRNCCRMFFQPCFFVRGKLGFKTAVTRVELSFCFSRIVVSTQVVFESLSLFVFFFRNSFVSSSEESHPDKSE